MPHVAPRPHSYIPEVAKRLRVGRKVHTYSLKAQRDRQAYQRGRRAFGLKEAPWERASRKKQCNATISCKLK